MVEKYVLLTQIGKAVEAKNLQSGIDEIVKANPDKTDLTFIVKPLLPEDEFSLVVDRLAKAAANNKCNGKVGSMLE